MANELSAVRKDPDSGRYHVIDGGSLIRDGKANGIITAGSSGTVDLYSNGSSLSVSVTAHS